MRPVRNGLITLTLLLSLASSLLAKPKEKTISAPRDAVFTALSKVIAKHHVVTFADEKNYTISFHTGTSLSSYGMNCTASIESQGDKSTVSINTQKTNGQLLAWGAGDRVANDIFKWLDEELKTAAKAETKQ